MQIIHLLRRFVNTFFKMYDKIFKKRKKTQRMNYYQRLKDIREDKGYDQKEIAQKLETTQQQISKYENGIQMMGYLKEGFMQVLAKAKRIFRENYH